MEKIQGSANSNDSNYKEDHTMKKIRRTLLMLCSALLISAPAYAVPQHFPAADLPAWGGTLWQITFYDDTASGQTQWATQNICLVQTGVQGSNTIGTWYSTTYRRWIGRFRQEGDQVRMIGDFWYGPGNDSIDWEITVRDKEGFGHWEEWIEDGFYGSWVAKGNTKLVKINGGCFPFNTTGLANGKVETLVEEQSALAPRVFKRDGSEATPIGEAQQSPISDITISK